METTMTMTMTMSCQDSSASAWCHCSTDLGGGDGAPEFLGLFGDLHSSPDDLFELVWRGAGGGGGGMKGQQPGPGCIPLSSRRPVAAAAAVVPVPERLAPPPPPAATEAPSEAEMASWLVPIVCSEEVSVGGGAVVAADRRRAWVDDGDQMVPSPSGMESSDHKLQEKRKISTGGRSHQHSDAHSLIEKRRRCKIKEKLKTLQQIVPGCDKNSNQASTLDQTIRYMKSLQEHIQAMSSFRCGMKPTSVAVYPVVQQAPCLACWWQMGHIVQRDDSWRGSPQL